MSEIFEKDSFGVTTHRDHFVQTYCRIVTAIQKTIEIQKALDEVYEEVEKDIV